MRFSDKTRSAPEDHLLITSSKQFARVLREGRFRGRAYALVDAGKLLLSTRPTAPALVGTEGVLQLSEISLPHPSAARSWWKSLWDGQYLDFYTTPHSLPAILVAAKAAVWRALPETTMQCPKRTFRRISEGSFGRLAGDQRSPMIIEASMLGISARVFVPKPRNRRTTSRKGDRAGQIRRPSQP